jgi:hypothetical protein
MQSCSPIRDDFLACDSKPLCYLALVDKSNHAPTALVQIDERHINGL